MRTARNLITKRESPTERQLQILQLKAAGRTNQEVADSLGVSLRTVKGHTNRILLKLDASNMVQAVAIAYEQGWLPCVVAV